MAFAQDRVSVWVEAIAGQDIALQFRDLNTEKKAGTYARARANTAGPPPEEELALPTEYVAAFCSERELISANRRRVNEKLGIVSEESKELDGTSNLNFKKN